MLRILKKIWYFNSEFELKRQLKKATKRLKKLSCSCNSVEYGSEKIVQLVDEYVDTAIKYWNNVDCEWRKAATDKLIKKWKTLKAAGR